MGVEATSGPQGELIIPAAKLGKLKGIAGGSLRFLRLCDDLLVCAQPQPGGRSRPLLYGDLRLFHVAELMALISAMRKDGSLTLLVPHARKTVFFGAGEVTFATSTVEDDRMGEVLWRRGYLSLEQLQAVHDLVTPEKKLGAVLVEHGLLTPRQLYAGIQEQVLEIVFSTFHFRLGEFLFIEEPLERKTAVQLESSTRDIIREGVRRVEEMTRLEEQFPEREAVLQLRPVTLDVQLDEHSGHLRKLVDGRRTVAELIAMSHLGEFDTLRALAHLRTVGLVDARQPEDDQRRYGTTVGGQLAGYAHLLRHIHQTLLAEVPGEEARLDAYLGSPPQRHRALFRHVAFDADGRLDVDALVRNARAEGGSDAQALALEALRGLYDYAFFQAMDTLDDEACNALETRLERLRAERLEGEEK